MDAINQSKLESLINSSISVRNSLRHIHHALSISCASNRIMREKFSGLLLNAWNANLLINESTLLWGGAIVHHTIPGRKFLIEAERVEFDIRAKKRQQDTLKHLNLISIQLNDLLPQTEFGRGFTTAIKRAIDYNKLAIEKSKGLDLSQGQHGKMRVQQTALYRGIQYTTEAMMNIVRWFPTEPTLPNYDWFSQSLTEATHVQDAIMKALGNIMNITFEDNKLPDNKITTSTVGLRRAARRRLLEVAGSRFHTNNTKFQPGWVFAPSKPELDPPQYERRGLQIALLRGSIHWTDAWGRVDKVASSIQDVADGLISEDEEPEI